MEKIKELIKKLLKAKEEYYNDTPSMTDEEFDKLEEELKKLDPKNDYFKVVGTKIENSKKKIKHEHKMLSLNKGKTVQDIFDWVAKINYSGSYQVLPKVDGLSSTFKYKNGKLEYISTRGDGLIGQDITHIKDYAKDILKEIKSKDEIEVRGELVIYKDEYPNPDKALRNICSGLVNRKDTGLADLKYVHFVAYELIGKTFKTVKEKLEWLEKEGFNVVDFDLNFKTQKELDSIYDKYLNKYRNEWKFETDGLVVIVNEIDKHNDINSLYTVEHHNHYNIALKPPVESKETVLESIEWNVTRYGTLVPVAIFKPVVIDNRTIGRASLSNLDNVLRLKLEKGDKIEVEVANMVIPYLTKNISKNVSQR